MPIGVSVAIGFALDLLLGDPRFLYHPVRLIGKLIELTEKICRDVFGEGRKQERRAGTLLVILVLFFSVMVPLLLLVLCFRVHFWLGFALEIFWSWQLLACRSLQQESMKVYRALAAGDLAGARRAVSMIVGRDTDALGMAGVTKAAVETIAESTADGVVAPLLFLVIAGPVGGFFYKAVNTMDSMVGYKNERYRYFGTAAARLDDILNFVPARIAGVLMVFASLPLGLDVKNSWRIFRRDRKKHASPNSAHTEAAMAGALDVELAGDAYYFGELVRKPTIGDPIREIETADIRRANRLMLVTSLIALALFCFLRYLIAAALT